MTENETKCNTENWKEWNVYKKESSRQLKVNGEHYVIRKLVLYSSANFKFYSYIQILQQLGLLWLICPFNLWRTKIKHTKRFLWTVLVDEDVCPLIRWSVSKRWFTVYTFFYTHLCYLALKFWWWLLKALSYSATNKSHMVHNHIRIHNI